MRKFFAVFAISGLLVATGCDAGTGEDGATDDATVTDAGPTDDGTGGTDAGASDTGGSADAGVTKTTYEAAVIWDGSQAAPTVCSGTGPGADIDYVAVYRNKKVIAVGKKGTASYTASKKAGCDKNEHADANDIAAMAGGLGDICSKGGKAVKDCKDSDYSDGYLSLGGGSVEIQFAKCEKQGTEDPSAANCSGDGAAFLLEAGDELDVYEVGEAYKTKYGWSKCKCADEGFEVDLRPKAGVDTGSITLGGATKTDTFTVPADK